MYPTLVLTALALGAPGLKEKPNPAAQIVAEWLLQSTTSLGKSEEPPNERTIWTFSADGKMTMRTGVQRFELRTYPYILDPKSKPATLDVNLDPDKEEREPYIFVAIVKLEGDTLTLCHDVRRTRPTTFEGPMGSTQVLLVFKRVNAK